MARSRGGARVDAWDHTTIIKGAWLTKGNATPTSIRGARGCTIARTGVGVLTITLDGVIVDLESFTCQLHMGTPDGSYACKTTHSIAGGIAVITVGTFNAAHAATDIAAHATNEVSFVIHAKRTGTR